MHLLGMFMPEKPGAVSTCAFPFGLYEKVALSSYPRSPITCGDILIFPAIFPYPKRLQGIRGTMQPAWQA